MLFNSEVAFISEVIANLKKHGVTRIPFDNKDFYNGVDRMASYFQKYSSSLGDVSSEISMLFIRNPFEHVYNRFRTAISLENGRYLSFVNPDYIEGVLSLSNEDATYILKKNRSGISNEFVEQCASEFCSGANVPCHF